MLSNVTCDCMGHEVKFSKDAAYQAAKHYGQLILSSVKKGKCWKLENITCRMLHVGLLWTTLHTHVTPVLASIIFVNEMHPILNVAHSVNKSTQ